MSLVLPSALPSPSASAVYFPEEVWAIICSYLFHDIRLGLHTRGLPYDKVMAELPRVAGGCDYIVWKGFFARHCAEVHPHVWILVINI